MNAGAALIFPGSRTVAGWWQQLAPYRPRLLWVAHLLVHRVEALVRVTRACPLDRLERLVLELLARWPAMSLETLDERLHLGRPLLRQVLQRLRLEGLVAAPDDRSWSLSPMGCLARERGEFPRSVSERRLFHFLDRSAEDRAPDFLALHNYRGHSYPAGAEWRFDPAWLTDCLGRPADWKQRHGFPLEVDEVLGPLPKDPHGSVKDESGASSAASTVHPASFILHPSASGASAGADEGEWQTVILDSPERIPVAIVLGPSREEEGSQTKDESAGSSAGSAVHPSSHILHPFGGGEHLHGLAFNPEGWVLSAAQPIFTLGDGWRETFPELAEDVSLENWGQAWRAWCQSRALTGPDAEPRRLERAGHCLLVSLARPFYERLRATQHQAFKGEVWLLAGEGRARAAALVEVVEAAPPHAPTS